jgi:branched-chain amino acid transport system permease protein
MSSSTEVKQAVATPAPAASPTSQGSAARPLDLSGGWLPTVIVWAALLSAPLWLPLIGGYTALASRVVVMGLVAMALNFLLGFTGQMSFGHAAYFGLGAYGAGLTLRYVANSTGLAMLDGILLGGVLGTVLGALIARRRGVYFAMITIAFGQIFYYIAYSWDSFTGGYDGLRGFSRQPIGFGPLVLDIQNSGTLFYYFVLFVFAVATAVMGLLLRSPFGRTLLAIRENERRARFLGIAVDRHIWLSFSIACFFASTAGALYALLNNFADPSALHYTLSGIIVIMVVMGGMRSFWGPLIGAAIYVVLQDYVSSITVNWMSVIGLMFVLVVMFFPRGILGMLKPRSRP